MPSHTQVMSDAGTAIRVVVRPTAVDTCAGPLLDCDAFLEQGDRFTSFPERQLEVVADNRHG
jgi:hypothetical protein